MIVIVGFGSFFGLVEVEIGVYLCMYFVGVD